MRTVGYRLVADRAVESWVIATEPAQLQDSEAAATTASRRRTAASVTFGASDVKRWTSSILSIVPDAQHDDTLIAHRVANHVVPGGYKFPNIWQILHSLAELRLILQETDRPTQTPSRPGRGPGVVTCDEVPQRVRSRVALRVNRNRISAAPHAHPARPNCRARRAPRRPRPDPPRPLRPAPAGSPRGAGRAAPHAPDTRARHR